MSIARFGFRCGLAAFVATIAYDVVQLMQLGGLLQFPLDEILIYGVSLCIVVPFVLEMLALHHVTPGNKQFWTSAAVIFTAMYAVFVTANYVVQLATVIPAKLGGRLADVRLLDQYPHSLFWDYDAAGYIFMGLASLIVIPALDTKGFEKWVRWSLIANSLVTPLIGTVYFYPTFSTRLLFFGFPWAITAPLFMLMLALTVRRRGAGLAPIQDLRSRTT